MEYHIFAPRQRKEKSSEWDASLETKNWGRGKAPFPFGVKIWKKKGSKLKVYQSLRWRVELETIMLSDRRKGGGEEV